MTDRKNLTDIIEPINQLDSRNNNTQSCLFIKTIFPCCFKKNQTISKDAKSTQTEHVTVDNAVQANENDLNFLKKTIYTIYTQTVEKKTFDKGIQADEEDENASNDTKERAIDKVLKLVEKILEISSPIEILEAEEENNKKYKYFKRVKETINNLKKDMLKDRFLKVDDIVPEIATPGKFGYIVYKAHDYQLKRYVSIHVTNSATNSNKVKNNHDILSFFMENYHENIIKYFEHFIINDKAYFVFEVLKCNFENVVATYDIPLTKMMELVKQFFQVLSFFKSFKIINVGMNNQNILFTPHLHYLKVTDFSNAVDEETANRNYASLSIRTDNYTAPEVLSKEMPFDEAADMWSVGCLLVELYTRKPLFKINIKNPENQSDAIFQKLGRANNTIGEKLLPKKYIEDLIEEVREIRGEEIIDNEFNSFKRILREIFCIHSFERPDPDYCLETFFSNNLPKQLIRVDTNEALNVDFSSEEEQPDSLEENSTDPYSRDNMNPVINQDRNRSVPRSSGTYNFTSNHPDISG